MDTTAAEVAQVKDEIESFDEDLKSLEEEVTKIDKEVAGATEQRKKEHSEYTETLQMTEAAIALLAKAKNRLQKFYNPTLYKAPPKTEMSMEEKIIDAGTFVQIKAHDQEDSDADTPPATWSSLYQKSEKSAGVIGLMDMMIKEIETDMKDAEYEEKTSQSDYAKLMSESEDSRAAASKGIV